MRRALGAKLEYAKFLQQTLGKFIIIAQKYWRKIKLIKDRRIWERKEHL